MTWLRFRSEWRRRWVSLGALTLLVALVGMVVLATVAGSARTRGTIERLDTSTRAMSAGAVFAGESLDPADAMVALPEVEAGDRAFTVLSLNAELYLPILVSVDGKVGTDLQRDRVLRGRRADPSEPLEVTLAEPLATRFGLDVGGSLSVFLPDRKYAPCLVGGGEEGDPACAELEPLFRSEQPDFTTLDGQSVELTLVGVTRGVGDVAARPDDLGLAVLTPAFYETYPESAWQPAALVRFREGVTSEEFEAALARAVPEGAVLEYFESSSALSALHATVGVLANGLLVFAGVAAFAGLVAVSQALARQAGRGAGERAALQALGATRAMRAADALAPLVPVAVAGAALAVVGAWLVSPAMPIGTAHRVEPDPGLQFDGAVLVLGGCALAAIVLGVAALAAAWVARGPAGHRARFRAGPRIGARVPVSVGIRFATDPGRGPRSVPVRSATAGVALGVAGVVAVVAFGAALGRLGSEPARYGYAWDLTISGEEAGEPEVDQDPALEGLEGPERAVELERLRSVSGAARAERIAADPDVDGVARLWLGYRAQVAGRSVTAYAIDPYEGSSSFVIVAGRAPAGAGEVALGAATMRRSGAGIGDTVAVGGTRVRVVGQALFPTTDNGYALADGVLLTPGDMQARRIVDDQGYNTFAVWLAPGADRDVVSERLRTLNNDEDVTIERVPAEVDQLRQLDDLPTFLAAFLIVVALLAVGHALVLTVRRRSGDLAVLRVLGFTPAQTGRTVAWQASTLALVGVVVGVPLGLVLGRFVWAAVARGYGVHDDPAWPWLALVLVLPVTVALANGVAWWPGRRASRIVPAQALRVE